MLFVYRNSRTSPAPTGAGIFGYENKIEKIKESPVSMILGLKIDHEVDLKIRNVGTNLACARCCSIPLRKITHQRE